MNSKNWINQSLNDMNIFELNDIQKETLPILLSNKNSILISKTGSGKTLAYLLLIFQEIDFSKKNPQSIIIMPTRELVRQLQKILSFFKKNFNDLSFVSLSDKNNKIEFSQIIKKQIIVCTPYVFFELSKKNEIIKSLKHIIIDEADMCLDLGFFNFINMAFNQINQIEKIKKIATSATLHENLSIQISKFFKNCTIINKNLSIWKNDNIKHFLVHHSNIEKNNLILNLIDYLNPYFAIVFCNTKKEVDNLFEFLYSKKINVLKLHGSLEKRKRKNVFNSIKNLKVNVLIATDLASRGIDIEGTSHVISYNLPKDDIWYIHRSGRCGRKHYKGKSYVIYEKNCEKQVSRLKNKGLVWNNLKFKNNSFLKFDFNFKLNEKKETEVDKQIQKIIQNAPKKIKPNYKKKIKTQISEVKRKAKRSAIEKSVNQQRIKKYKIENAKKTKEKKLQKELEEKALKNKKRRKLNAKKTFDISRNK